MRRSPEESAQSRLKTKVSSVFAMWKETNQATWDDWLADKIAGLETLGATRSVLVVADLLSPQDAIESLRNRNRTA